MNLYDDLIYRGMLKDVSDEKKARELLDDNKIKFYIGYDPTAESLTIGHLVQIIRMRYLQQFGHTPIVLIGGATGLIGDPRMTSERKLLTLDVALKNAEKIKNQISNFFPDTKNTIYVNNYDWTKDIDAITFLRDYGKYFTINYMLDKDVVKRRLDVGISYTEFSYMILQSIDWLNLYQKYNCQIQFGGSDQWGNITAGLDLMKKMLGTSDCVGLSSPLLLKADGQKFGKSESGALFLDKESTSPYELYQYFINTSDADVETQLKVLTLLPSSEIKEIMETHLISVEKHYAQERLTKEIIVFVHGIDEYNSALHLSNALFKEEFDKLSSNEFDVLYKNEFESEKNKYSSNTLIDLLIESGLAQSKRETREFLTGSAIKINSKVVKEDIKINEINKYFDKYFIIKRGKKIYKLFNIEDFQ
jgi:tyrosyl-tRNA synthetase